MMTSAGTISASAADDDFATAPYPDWRSAIAESVGPVANSLPVHRFFNLKNGSHFYTASETEKNEAVAKCPTVYRLEGPAFWIGQ